MTRWARALSPVLLWVVGSTLGAAAPVLFDGGVVNSADYSAAVAPGMILSIFGEDLAPGVDAARSIPLPEELLGVSVEINDGLWTQRAPLFFVSAGQINAQLPFDLASASIQVRVLTAQGASNTITTQTAATEPRLFTKTQDGRGEAILAHVDGSLVSEQAPAQAGEWVVLYLTGLGAVDPPVAAGEAGRGDPLSWVTTPVAVTVNRAPASVYFAGLAPGFAGLYQVNFQIPETATAGRAAISVTAGGSSSQRNVTLDCDLALTPLGSAAVSSAGGALAVGDAAVTVPAGAFAATEQIALYAAKGSGSYPADSALFVLEGLPDSTAGPIAVSLPVAGTGSGPAYLVIEEEGGTGAATLLEAVVSAGRASAAVPTRAAAAEPQRTSTDAAPKAVSTARARRQLLYISYGIVCEDLVDGRFHACHDRSMPTELVQGLDSSIRRHLERLAGLGFRTTDIGLSAPVPLSFVSAPIGAGTVRYSSFDRRNAIAVEIDPEWTSLNLGHTLCHYLQAQSDRMTEFRHGAPATPWTWFHEAVAAWYDETQLQDPSDQTFVFHTEETYASSLFFLNRPLQYGGGAGGYSAWDHGAGAASFVYFLNEDPADAGWIAGVTQRWTPSNTPVDALKQAGLQFSSAWPDFGGAFLESFVSFESGLFPESSGEVLLQDGVQWRRGLDPTLPDEAVRFPWPSAPDLSALFGYVQLVADTPAGKAIEVSLTQGADHATALLYEGFGPETLRYLGEVSGASVLRLSPNEIVLENGVRIWVLLANHRAVAPYSGASEVELLFAVRAEASDEILSKLQTQPELRANLRATVRCTDPSSGDELACPNVVYTNWSDLGEKYADVAWNGSSFSMEGSWASAPTPSGDRWLYAERVEGTYDAATQTISGSVWHRKVSEQTGIGSSAGYRFRDVPLVPLLLFDGVNFEIRGEATASHIHEVQAHYIRDGQEQDGLLKVEFTGQSYFWITFGPRAD
ncbi:MAG: hypothetical protein GC160_08515 [Acidobacteria bacterium]|nr:hypothetical protein [Acidobacteriota bacterium]